MMRTTRYAEKIQRIRNGSYNKGDFIIADAKDADMSGGIRATGPRRGTDGTQTGWRSRKEFRAAIERIVRQDVVDIMLVSASNLERLARDAVFATTRVQPAFRANDTTDVWAGIRHGSYASHPSVPYRSVDLDLAGGQETLALYSITFTNSTEADLRSLDAYARFRREARAVGQRHFLEVFNPNVDAGIDARDVPAFVNDCILRTMAGLTEAERPEFLKIAYNGPDALSELVHYDPELVVGILGGGAGTTRDTFELISQAERFGGRVALFGRRINFAEDEPLLISFLRAVVDGKVDPVDAVKAYHDQLAANGMKADRMLGEDLKVSEDALRAAAA